jgi:hypothetical protein
MYPLFDLLHADGSKPAFSVTDAAAFAQVLINVKITVFLSAYRGIGAIQVA